MSDSLAQSLVDAAAEAIGETICDHLIDQGQASCDRCDGNAAALAVVEKLSAQTHEFAYLNGGDFQDLADAIREGR